MASFRIHKDLKIINKNVIKKKLQSGICRKRAMITRSALQPLKLENLQAKRSKIGDGKKPRAVVIESAAVKKNGELELIVAKTIQEVAEVRRPTKVEMFSDTLLYNAEYKEDMWVHLRSLEDIYEWPKPNYLRKQEDVNKLMRNILVDWLVAVADEYKMNEQTVHLAVNYMDRFLSHMAVTRDKFQLLGAAAMMLAGKVEEIYPPDTKEWCYLTANSYTRQQIIKMEQLILKCLKFDVQPPTMLSFIQHLCVEHDLDKETLFLAMYLSELVMMEGDVYLNFLPSKLAAASVGLARMILRKENPWPARFETFSGYTFKQLHSIVRRQNMSFTDSPTKSQKAIFTKYESARYCRVSTIKPRVLKLNEFEDD